MKLLPDKFWWIFFRIQENISSYLRSKKNIYYLLKAKRTIKSFKDPLKINGKTVLSPFTTLGRNTHLNGLIIRGKGEVIIGDNFHAASGCLFLTSIHNYDSGEKIPYDHTVISKDIIIEDNVWLGSDVIVLGGVRIGEGAIIQAGSVVVSSVEKYAIVGGHPGRKFSTRDIDHYELLKSQAKFH